MRTKALDKGALTVILKALYNSNRLVCLCMLETSLRVSDVLSFKTDDIRKERFTIFEQKTGKRHTVRLPLALREAILKQSGRVYAFEHRLSPYKHRTRQAVWKDLNRVARLYGIKHLRGLAPHSMRKSYAVDLREAGLSVSAIQKALNHSDPAITALYCMADVISLDN